MRSRQLLAKAIRSLVLTTSIGAALTAQVESLSAPYQVDYNHDIRPILSDNCFACHGPDEKARKAKLRLDRSEYAYAARDGKPAIKPGDLLQSELWQRINAQDAAEHMPPAESHRALADAQKQQLRAWIEQGAVYAEHWAFVPPRKSPPPADDVSPIDAFIQAKLAAEGLTKAPAADRATLIRRASLDLTGLPPSALEVLAFTADTDPLAWEHLIDRLLSSPHYGEGMALPWLDASRYADTNGFSIDGGRHAWLWRDYVINAFQVNKPYDRFLVEQLAGDLLAAPTAETRIASGFQRNSMITHEGGTIAEENLINYGADRVKTLGEAILGLTLGCAQCHNHKFDPITQQDYYSLFAYFNATNEPAHGGDGGVNAAPTVDAHSVLVTGEEDALRDRIAALEVALATPSPAVIAAWEAQQRQILATRGRGLILHPVRLLKISTPNSGSGFKIRDERYAEIEALGGAAFDVSMSVPKLWLPITGLRIVMHPSPDHPEAGWGHGGGTEKKHTFVLTNVSLSAGPVPSDQVNLYRLLKIARVTANCWDAANRPEGVLNTNTSEGYSPDLSHEGPAQLTTTFSEPLPSDTAFLTAQLNFGQGNNLLAKRMEFFLVSGEDGDSDLPPIVIEGLGVAPTKRTTEQSTAILDHIRAHADALARTRNELANARERLAVRTDAFSALVMDTAEHPRETFILNRGNYADPSKKVTPNTPAILPPLPIGAPANRLGLARWVTMQANPLTARVAVNRFWQMLFGIGLVRTAADFGTQGEWPSHPQLLDWLAVEFVELRWDVKALLREILLSNTYQQASATTDEASTIDRDNRLLARGPRFRLQAELVRDAALKISGLLVPQIGGPSVQPYTPGDPWREISHYGSSGATAQSFIQDHGDKLYRRSLYTYWKRTLPPPNMAIFDAPNREVCVVDRTNTNTPLQALVLLNDVQFVEAARAFAERILHRAGTEDERLSWAFAEATSRACQPRELAVLHSTLARERRMFAAQPDQATRLLATGESLRDTSLAPVEHAAWMQVAALLLNLSETITHN
ncbi:MAG: PSD1 and planctomycete cytochrome C domain-containing protein [Planctomycetota bacterium]|nr:PSD1 and planctomycete cytochrome C domain-containing protein [Planctomycetota bacterium]